MQIAKEGGSIAGDTRKAIEQRTGEPVLMMKNKFECMYQKAVSKEVLI